LDEGDPLQKVPHRDRLMRLAAPFTAEPGEVMKIQHRFSRFDWTVQPDQVLLTEYDRDRRWRTTALVDLGDPANSRRVLFDLSARDVYHDPGDPVYETRPDGTRVLHQDGDWIYLAADGASETGDRPRLDRFNLQTREKETLFQSGADCLESFVAFAGPGRTRIVTRHESKTEPPNYVVVDLGTQARTALTDFQDPAPQLTGLKKELIRYARPDGVPLSGTLYLPPGYVAGTKLPLVIWAYPLEYSDPATAGQVRSSPNSFTFFRGATPLLFVTQGYAVLMDATMPVVGDPETMNNTFVEQITAAGRAAIDRLDAMGVIDRRRVLVMGHSYGAFMTANLLAHSDDFAAGIARSGAYNRSLTPFGFQSERRSFWEATEVYMKVSPFTYANKINEPLLLIHGQADNNSGTHTMQSERLYQALKGNGGTARLVLLPFESHGYTARESVLHTLAEMFDWADKYVKNRPVK
jgi:dipeptidyl aminopeptidase/acylaminoacyl peptidase